MPATAPQGAETGSPRPGFLKGAYSALFLRRKTISPRKRTANTAQTMRIIELSIVFSPFAQN